MSSNENRPSLQAKYKGYTNTYAYNSLSLAQMDRMQQLQENHHLDSQSICLLDVLREPLEAFDISHLADDAAHKYFKRADIGVGQINPSLANGEVGQAHMV